MPLDAKRLACRAHLDQELAAIEQRWAETPLDVQREFADWVTDGMPPLDDADPGVANWREFAARMARLVIQDIAVRSKD